MYQKKETRVNKDIRASVVILIDEDGKRVGSVHLNEALGKASSVGMDLMEVGSQKGVPICKIIDYGKWCYEQSKRNKKNKNQSQKNKEIQFRPNTGDNDLAYRAKRVDQFIKEGYKIKLCVKFRGREMEHMYDTGKDLLERFLDLLSSNYQISGDAKAEGNTITLRINSENA